mmetsp:Transcript_15549/g.21290  ORF Transcript_15549/g.21290 Transcript_15549/m.21290 type:complete len:181 (-) Transcript_15549:13-555(-)
MELCGDKIHVRNQSRHHFCDLDLFAIEDLPGGLDVSNVNSISNVEFRDVNGTNPIQLSGRITTVWNGDAVSYFDALSEGDEVFMLGRRNKVYGTFSTFTTPSFNGEYFELECNIRCQSGDSGALLFVRTEHKESEFTAVGICVRFTPSPTDSNFGILTEFVPLTKLDPSSYALPQPWMKA